MRRFKKKIRSAFGRVVNSLLQKVGKRMVNVHSPAKPFEDGVFFLKKIIKNPAWIIDVGSAGGTPDLTVAFPFGEYKYLLVEANPHFYPSLDVLQSTYKDSVFIEKCFCGEADTTTSFSVSASSYKSSRYVDVGEKITVPVKRLDAMVKSHGIQGPIFLKIDVEGAELDVLTGAVETLAHCDVVILESWINVREINPAKDFSAVVSFMKQHGFVVFDFFGGHNYRDGLLKHLDVVFVKENGPYRKV